MKLSKEELRKIRELDSIIPDPLVRDLLSHIGALESELSMAKADSAELRLALLEWKRTAEELIGWEDDSDD